MGLCHQSVEENCSHRHFSSGLWPSRLRGLNQHIHLKVSHFDGHYLSTRPPLIGSTNVSSSRGLLLKWMPSAQSDKVVCSIKYQGKTTTWVPQNYSPWSIKQLAVDAAQMQQPHSILELHRSWVLVNFSCTLCDITFKTTSHKTVKFPWTNTQQQLRAQRPFVCVHLMLCASAYKIRNNLYDGCRTPFLEVDSEHAQTRLPSARVCGTKQPGTWTWFNSPHNECQGDAWPHVPLPLSLFT